MIKVTFKVFQREVACVEIDFDIGQDIVAADRVEDKIFSPEFLPGIDRLIDSVSDFFTKRFVKRRLM